MRERPIVSVPNLSATLRSLEPGDYVDLGTHWSYGSVRETASQLKVNIATKQTAKGITVMRQYKIPEPK